MLSQESQAPMEPYSPQNPSTKDLILNIKTQTGKHINLKLPRPKIHDQF